LAVIVRLVVVLLIVVLAVVVGAVRIIRATFIIAVSIIIDGLRFGKYVGNAVFRFVTFVSGFSSRVRTCAVIGARL